MFTAALIVFREVLEAALVVTIVMAATIGVPRRGFWVGLGVVGGVMGACAVATLTTFLSSLFEGTGQEIVNAGILFLAVILIGWHVVWMNSHGRKMADEMRAVSKKVSDGEKHMSVLAIIVGLAVMREGSEVVLMLQGLWLGGSHGVMIGGALIGLVGGVLTGGAMYAGLVALPIGRVFALTNGLLVLIAAGMAARAANFLVQGGLLPPLRNRLWDTSWVLSDQSVVGQFLGALVGYIARPTGIEVLFYGSTLVIVIAMMGMARRHFSRRLAFGLVALVLCGSCLLVQALALA